jgi:hypothetical protein
VVKVEGKLGSSPVGDEIMGLRAPFGLSDWRAFRRPFDRPQTHPQARHFYHKAAKRFRRTLAAQHPSAADWRWCTARDMYPARRALYGAMGDNPADYLTDVEHSITTFINGRERAYVLLNKVLMQQMIGPLAATPRILGLVIDGKPDPAYSGAISGRVFVKPLDGYRGIGITAVDAGDLPAIMDAASRSRASFFISEAVEQHEWMRSLSPFSVNTIKVMTIREPQTRTILPIRAVLRIGTKKSSPVDNWTQGGVAFGLDVETGSIGTGVSKEDMSRRLHAHPDTGAQITDRVIPFISDIVEKCTWVHARMPFLNWAGWDMTMTPGGEPLVIEANPYIDVDVFQTHQPLLTDPRVRTFFEHHGVI